MTNDKLYNTAHFVLFNNLTTCLNFSLYTGLSMKSSLHSGLDPFRISPNCAKSDQEWQSWASTLKNQLGIQIKLRHSTNLQIFHWRQRDKLKTICTTWLHINSQTFLTPSFLHPVSPRQRNKDVKESFVMCLEHKFSLYYIQCLETNGLIRNTTNRQIAMKHRKKCSFFN